MITLNKIGGTNNLKEAEFYCLSTDKKPIYEDIPNGSKLHIIDYKTAKVSKDWVYDAENKIWYEIVSKNGGEGGESSVNDYLQLTNKPKINNIELKGNKTSTDLGLADIEDIQMLEDNKANYTYKVIADDKVSQTDAREILTFIDQYEGKLIEFLTNGDNPSKAVATGRILTDKQGNNYLLTYNLDGTITQWSKEFFEKHTIESYNFTNQMIDLDDLTIDVQGQAPFVATVNNAFNKPKDVSNFGNIFVFAYNTEKQIQIYRDMEDGVIYQRLITGQPNKHSFGTWSTNDSNSIYGTKDNIYVNTDFRIPIVTSRKESWVDDTEGFVNRWTKSNNINCNLVPQGLHCSKGISNEPCFIMQKIDSKFTEILHSKILCISLLLNNKEIVDGAFIYQKSPNVNNTIFQNDNVNIELRTDGQIYINIKNDCIISSVKLEIGDVSTLKNDSPMNPELNKIETLGSFYNLETYLDLFFNLRKNGKVYQTELFLFDSNPTSTGIKTLSNKNLVCEPSTDTTEGRDDYDGIGLFDWYDCNYITNEYGRKIPTAIKGFGNDFIDDGFHDVGVIQMTPYWNVEEKDGKQIWTISDTPNEEYGLVGWEYSRKEDGSFAPYIVHSKYHSSIGKDGLLRSIGNAVPERNLSHNKIITESQKKGKQCWGSSIERNTFQLLFQIIKYSTKNSQSLWTGCTNYSYVYPASLEYVEEQTYFPVTNEQAKNLIVGSRVSVGYNDNRAYSDAHVYADSAKILKIETLDEQNKAVYLDIEKGFSTNKVEGKSVNLLTMHWASGTTNKIIGKHDGSFGSNTDYKHPYRIQGLEFSVGGYIIPTDVIMNFQSDYSKDILLAKMGQTKSTSDSIILSTYNKVGNIPNVGDGGDFYIGDIGIDVKTCAWYPLRKGTSSTNGHGDYCYAGGKYTSGTREFLTGGGLGGGASAGSVFLYCWDRLGSSFWYWLGCD